MKCENFLCVYQLNGECTIENICIDGLGMCSECIYPDIDKEVLAKAKKTLLEKYENR